MFSPLKVQWGTVCHDYIQKYPGIVITRFIFNGLFLLKSVIPSNLIGDFKVCSIYPVNRQAVKPNDITKNTKSGEQECSKGSESNKSNETVSTEHEESVPAGHEDVGSTQHLIGGDDEINPDLEKNLFTIQRGI